MDPLKKQVLLLYATALEDPSGFFFICLLVAACKCH